MPRTSSTRTPAPAPADRNARIAREIQSHLDAIARLTAELGPTASVRPPFQFKRKGLTQEQFEAALTAQGKL